MAKIQFQHEDGSLSVVDVADGTSVMRAAIQNGVPGIVGECGGQAMCATCHIYVHVDYLDRLPPIGVDEEEMLECTAAPKDDQRSRLGCQIAISEALDGLTVDVPTRQV